MLNLVLGLFLLMMAIPSSTEQDWYFGEGLKQGDYFSYNVCHFEYYDCREIRINMWIKGDVQNDAGRWLAEVVVFDEEKIVKGEIEFGKIAAEPVSQSKELNQYSYIIKTSLTDLATYASLGKGGNLKEGEPLSYRTCSFWCGGIPVSQGIQTISVPAGTYDAHVLTWKSSWNSTAINQVWVVDDFPFPIKGIAYSHHETKDKSVCILGNEKDYLVSCH